MFCLSNLAIDYHEQLSEHKLLDRVVKLTLNPSPAQKEARIVLSNYVCSASTKNIRQLYYQHGTDLVISLIESESLQAIEKLLEIDNFIAVFEQNEGI